MDVSVFLPILYVDPLQKEAVLDINSISIESTYNGQKFDVEWTQNSKHIVLNALDSTKTLQNIAPKLNAEDHLNESQMSDDLAVRMTRSVENEENVYFNRYLQKVVETEHIQTEHSNVLAEALPSFLRNGNLLSTNDRILASLPSNRTIYFDCGDNNPKLCLEGKFRVSNIKASNQPILITVNFTMEMNRMAKIMTDQKDILVIRTSINLMKTSNEDT